MGSPGPVWERDVCWLEYGDIIIDETGNELGFGVVIRVVNFFSWTIQSCTADFLFEMIFKAF